MVAAAAVRPGELVLDIGAGEGALTRHLVSAGARVIAVELHPGRLARLKQRFAGDPVTVVHADAGQLRLPGRPFRVVSNPPYHLSSTLLRTLLVRDSRLTAADIVLQRAAVRRYAEGRASDRWRQRYRVWQGLRVPRTAFGPPPRVDSAVLVVRRRR